MPLDEQTMNKSHAAQCCWKFLGSSYWALAFRPPHNERRQLIAPVALWKQHIIRRATHVVQKLQVCVSILLLAVVKLDAVQCISTCGGYWCCHRCRRCHRCWRHWRHWRHGCRDSHRWSWGCNRWVIGGAKGIVTSGADGCAIRQVPTIVGILVAVAHHGLEAAVVMHHDFGALGTSQDASSGGGKQSQAVHTYRRNSGRKTPPVKTLE